MYLVPLSRNYHLHSVLNTARLLHESRSASSFIPSPLPHTLLSISRSHETFRGCKVLLTSLGSAHICKIPATIIALEHIKLCSGFRELLHPLLLAHLLLPKVRQRRRAPCARHQPLGRAKPGPIWPQRCELVLEQPCASLLRQSHLVQHSVVLSESDSGLRVERTRACSEGTGEVSVAVSRGLVRLEDFFVSVYAAFAFSHDVTWACAVFLRQWRVHEDVTLLETWTV